MSRKHALTRILDVVIAMLATQVCLLVAPALGGATPSPGRWTGTVTFTDHTSGTNQGGEEINEHSAITFNLDGAATTFSGNDPETTVMVQGQLSSFSYSYRQAAACVYNETATGPDPENPPSIVILVGDKGSYGDGFYDAPGTYTIYWPGVSLLGTDKVTGEGCADETTIKLGPGEVDEQPAPFGPSFPLGSDPTELKGSSSGSEGDVGAVVRKWTYSWDLHLVESPDSDGDGLSDYLEKVEYGTDPNNPDTDGDGYSDGAEVAACSDPLDPNSIPDAGCPKEGGGENPDGGNPGGGGPSTGPGAGGGNPGGGPPPPPPPPPNKQPVFVAMGDSYSAGEGSFSYFPETNQLGHNECHRSPLAYSQLIGSLTAMDNVFVACSGATTVTLRHGGKGDGAWGEDQMQALTSIKNSQTQYVKDITLTIGGNDVGFSPIIKTCVTAKLTHKLLTHGKECREVVPYPNLAELRKLLRETYREIHREAPSAEVFVLGYPRLFAREPHSDRCDVYTKDAIWANHLTEHVDGVILGATVEAGPYIHFVNTWNAFNNHELCRHGKANKSYLHGAMFKSSAIKHVCIPPTLVTAMPGASCVIYVEPDAHVESFHPNELGYKALARALEAALP